nr:methanogenesis marker 15 protein [uncultured Methanobrevibacter sp.]
MVKVAIYPPNSLILADLIERKGHTPLVLQKQIRQKIKDPEIDSPPMNITEEDPIKGLKYAAIEVPSGVRGRMSIIGPLIDEAEAAIIVDGAPFGFGCIGCARTNELSIFLLRNRDIPVLEITYPTNQDETYVMVNEISCGTEYSGIQKEIEKAANKFGAEIILPEIDLDYIDEAYEKFGFSAQSSSLKLMIARAMAIVEGKSKPDAVFIATCFRCAEAALVRNEVRRFIQNNTRIPVVTYSFTERTKADELFIRMEALATTVTRRSILAREKQEGLTLGLDSGSTTTKAVLMENNKVIGTGWTSTKDIIESAKTAAAEAFGQTDYGWDDVDGIGTTGYGRFTMGQEFGAELIQEELSVNAKGAVYLADRQKGEATVLDIGGMDNKVITVNNGIPDNFTMGGICAGASGRFLDMTSRRLDVDITELGPLAVQGDWRRAMLNSYCIVFGIQDLVTTLAAGGSKADVAAAACHSVSEQVYEQQLQEIDIREPLIQVGGTSLISGLVEAVSETLGGIEVIVPEYSQHIGAVGAALLVSGMGHRQDNK